MVAFQWLGTARQGSLGLESDLCIGREEQEEEENKERRKEEVEDGMKDFMMNLHGVIRPFHLVNASIGSHIIPPGGLSAGPVEGLYRLPLRKESVPHTATNRNSSITNNIHNA